MRGCEHLEVEQVDGGSDYVWCRFDNPGCKGCPDYLPIEEDDQDLNTTTSVEIPF